MLAPLRRLWIETEDWLRHSPRVRNMAALYKAWTHSRPAPESAQELARSIKNLCAVARLALQPAEIRGAEQRILRFVEELDPAQVDWSEFVAQVADPRVARGVILKPYVGPRERGVIYVGFESEWMKLLQHAPLREFARRYQLIVAPSSNPYNLINFVFPNVYPGPLYTLINHDQDLEILSRVSRNYRVVPLYTSHWVNPASYQPRPRRERDIDLLMVAAWGKVKRHHLLFGALRHMSPSLKVVLIGQEQDGRTQEVLRSMAHDYGVAGRFETRSNLSHPQVREAFCRSRISVLLSLREGSAVVVPESLFADTPTALLHDAYNGSRAFINNQTGRFLHEKSLAAELTDFLAHADSYQPRQWALENISCHKSSEKLNAILRRDALANGEEWTRDLYPLCWQPDPRLVRPEDWLALREERETIREQLQIEVGPERLE